MAKKLRLNLDKEMYRPEVKIRILEKKAFIIDNRLIFRKKKF